MSQRLRLSILDFGMRRHWEPSRMAVAETVRLAQLADAAGFARYWLAEHDAMSDAWGPPTTMVGYLASRTRSIRVGTAGTLISFHDPFDVAQDFRMLECLYPGRIDLGIAGGSPSAPGLRTRHGDPGDLRAAYGRAAEQLVRFARMRATDPGFDPAGVVPLPIDVPARAPWMLGAGVYGRDLALRLGTAYCYSLFHSPTPSPDALRGYFDRFVPNEFCPAPMAAIAATVICAETEPEAHAIREAQRDYLVERQAGLTAVGSPRQCAEILCTAADTYGVTEVVLHDMCRTAPERRRCYALLAAELGLPRTDAPTPPRDAHAPAA